MPRHVYLADLFRAGGLEVIERPGARTRGAERFVPSGDVIHVTVTGPNVSDQRVEDLLANGRPDLAGPLSQRGTSRTGAVHVVACGRSNHNGYGYMGNDAFGNEMFNDGYDELITAEQLHSSIVQSALLCRYNGWRADRVMGHKETDPKRKIDPRSTWMPGFRAEVAAMLINGIPTDGEFTMDQYATLLNAINHVSGNVDEVKRLQNENNDELFHFPEMTEPVPVTGQRKSQFWRLLTAGGKVDALQVQVNGVGERLTTIERTQQQILARLPAPPVPDGK